MRKLFFTALLILVSVAVRAGDVEIIRRSVLPDDGYCGWPTICRTSGGELLVVYSGARQTHIDPWGQVRMIRSTDNGLSWSEPVTPVSTILDDRDAGIIELRDGSLLIFWFNSIAWIDDLENGRQWNGLAWQDVDPAIDQHTRNLPPKEELKTMLGNFCARSTDGGKTWGLASKLEGSAPHGGIQLRSGKLIHAGRDYTPDKPAICIETSGDKGRTWKKTCELAYEEGLNIDKAYEPHIVEAADGTLIVTCRYQGPPRGSYMIQSESHDKGRTWTPLHLTEVRGYPPHTILLPDGSILLTYARRENPLFGQYARISRDNGNTWGEEWLIDTGFDGDNGYPSTTLLPDGSFLTVYYGAPEKGARCQLITVNWRVK